MEEIKIMKEVSATPERVLSYVRSVQWKHWMNRPYYPFVATFCWSGLHEKYFEKNGFDYLNSDILYQFPNLYYSDDFERRSNEWATNFFSGNKVERLSSMLANTHGVNMSALQEVLTSDDDIDQRLQKYFELCRMYMPFLWILLAIENHFSKKIDDFFPKYLGVDYKKAVADLSVPTKKNVYALMISALENGESTEEVQKKFGWMKSRDGFSPFYTLEEIEEIRKNHEPFSASSFNNIPDGLHELVDDLRELSFFRTDRTDKFYELLNGGRLLFEELAHAQEISFDEIKYCDAQALVQGKIKKYEAGFSYTHYGNEYIIQEKPFFKGSNISGDEEIKGSIAFRGKVRGVVKVVTVPEDVSRVEDGDVLVSQMTFPSFIAAMQKAVAFVTDEGGITCHAAIIAREMKKPCIIGTKIATQVLKDGDLVEVDADNGVVRVLERAKN